MAAPTVSADTIDQLEEGIQRTVALVNRLRDERDLARVEVAEALEAKPIWLPSWMHCARKSDVRTRLEKPLVTSIP
jgi:hypothetical protein